MNDLISFLDRLYKKIFYFDIRKYLYKTYTLQYLYVKEGEMFFQDNKIHVCVSRNEETNESIMVAYLFPSDNLFKKGFDCLQKQGYLIKKD